MPLDESGPESSPFEAAALEAVLMRFESAWKGDSAPPLEEFLTDSGSRRGVLLRELIYVDLECRLTRGEPARVEAYLQRYPELADDIPFCLDLLAREYYFRQRTEPQLGFAEYEQRFPKFGSELRKLVATIVPRSRPGRLSRFSARLNCPHCHNPIEIIAESAQEEVVCPSCGSSLKLDGGQTLTWDKQRLPHIEQFELLEAVGRGAFGTVYKARDSQLQRLVAIKIPRSGVLATDEDEDRFVREARNAAQLQHPGIVTVFSVGRTETFPYLISEFVDGVTLAQYLTAKRFTMREAARLTQDIALGLQHAHEHGVIHRDLKPSNIMLTPGGQPRIMDFGFAKRDAGEITMTLDGQVLGTPAYMSPEQAKGQAHTADARSDIYSIGVILFQLLTGELPFRGDVRMLLHQVIHDEPPNPRRLNDQVPRDLATISLKCLAKESERRYVNASEVAADLHRYLDGHPILARPVGPLERAWRWTKRNPRYAVMSATILLLLTSIAIGSTIGMFVLAEQKRQANVAREKEKRARDEETKQLAEVRRQKVLVDAQRRAAVAAQVKAGQERDRANAKELETRRFLYDSHMNQVQAAWDKNRVGRVIQFLKRYEAPAELDSDPRGFEWYYWQRQSHRDLITIAHHTEWIVGVAFSPDGKQLVSPGTDKSIRVWSPRSGQVIQVLHGHDHHVLNAAFSPDGTKICSIDVGGSLRVWRVVTGHEIWKLAGPTDNHPFLTTKISFHPDGKQLIYRTADQTTKLFDLETGAATLTLEASASESASGVVINPNGRQYATLGSDIKLRDLTTGTVHHTISGIGPWFSNLAFSPEGRRIAVTCFDGSIKIWDTESGALLRTLVGHESFVIALAYSPDGTQIATGGIDQTIRQWDISTGQNVRTLKGHTEGVFCVSFSPKGDRLASSSLDGTIKLWDTTPEANEWKVAKWNEPVECSAVSTDGRQYAIVSGHKWVQLWDTEKGSETRTLAAKSKVRCVTFSRDGKQLASGNDDDTISIWNTSTGHLLQTFYGHTRYINTVAFSPDGKRIALNGRNHAINLCDTSTGLILQTLEGHSDFVTSIAFSPDGRHVASASCDHTVKLWKAADGQEICTLSGHTSRVNCLAFNANGSQIVSGSGEDSENITAPSNVGEMKLWSVLNHKELLTLTGQSSRANRVVFSPDGSRLGSAHADGTIKLWDSFTGQETLSLKGYTSSAIDIGFSSDGTRIITASSDRTLTAWVGGSVTQEVPSTVRGKLSTGQFSPELLRQAIQTAEKFRTLEPVTSSHLYDSGDLFTLCLKGLSTLDLPDKDRLAKELRSKAFATLQAAVAAGFEGGDQLARSPDFEPLRDLPEFIALVKQLPRANLAFRPANAELPQVSSSHVSRYDDNEKANDGIINYENEAFNRWTAYESVNPSDWLQIEFEQETAFSRVELALYDEGPTGGVQLPASYTVQYWNGTDWKDASEQKKSPEVPKPNAINEVRFAPVKSKKVRVVFTHQGTSRSGVTEFMVWP